MPTVLWFIVRWSLRLVPLVVLGVLLHFYLPQHDVVRIVGTEVNRMDRADINTAGQAGSPATTVTRDVRFINAVRANGKPSVYRNEDTDWGFPWYFKFDSGNLQAAAQDAISSQAAARWVKITHYGWRIEIFSMFPNAVEIGPVEDSEATIIPWFNIVFFVVLAILWFLAWRAWRRFLTRLEFDTRFDNASSSLAQVWRWIKANLRDLRGRPR